MKRIRVLIIAATIIALVVLLSVLAPYVTLTSEERRGFPLEQPPPVEAAFSAGCVALRYNYSCRPEAVASVSVEIETGDHGVLVARTYGLLEVCEKKGYGADAVKCARMCGCRV